MNLSSDGLLGFKRSKSRRYIAYKPLCIFVFLHQHYQTFITENATGFALYKGCEYENHNNKGKGLAYKREHIAYVLRPTREKNLSSKLDTELSIRQTVISITEKENLSSCSWF